MAHTVQIGSIRCHILSDGRQATDCGGWFGLVPRVLWQQVMAPNADHCLPWDSRCLLIESDAGLILVDTGSGDKIPAKRRQQVSLASGNDRVVRELASVGFTPEDVDTVVMTHFHGDHCGGNTRWQSDDGSPTPAVPVFPRATYLGQRIDLADATFPNERTRATYDSANWQPMLARDQFNVVDGPQRIATGVRTEIARGHTASIQVVWVESQGDSLCFLTDAASWAVHLERLAWVPAFDVDPMTSIETKRSLRHTALERNTLLVFQHDPHVVAGRLQAGARGPHVVPAIREDPWTDPLGVEESSAAADQ